jgi:hypothetical protein
MTRLSRRRFLTVAAAAALATAAGAAWTKRRALRQWLVFAPPGRTPVGPLPTRTEVVMRALVPALLGEPIEPGHYLDDLRWRAEHLPGHRGVMVRFAADLDAAARRRGATGFDTLPREAQRAVLASLRPLRGWRRAWRGLAERGRAQASEHVVRVLLARFAGTDAWVRLGYPAWPGVPRAITTPHGAGT